MNSSKLLISNAKICLKNSIIDGSVLIENGKICEVFSESDYLLYHNEKIDIYDMKGRYLLPGFVDIHCHGANGSSFMDCNKLDFENILSYYLKKGTTTIFPTSLACDDEQLILFLKTYESFFKENSYYNVMMGGCHLEGPYLSTEKAGAQVPSKCKEVDFIFAQYILNKYSHIKRWTIAPEKDQNYCLANMLKKKEIITSAGHTCALYREMKEAFKNGYTHMTHLYSGMNSMIYIEGLRQPGAVEAALLDSDVTVELIGDGIHLPYPFIEIVYRIKGADKIAIISDGMRGTGTKKQKSILGSRKTGTKVILKNGVAMLPDYSSLAGSITPLSDMFRGLVDNTSIPFEDIVKMCSYSPACIMNIQNIVGEIKKGCVANLIDMDDKLNIVNVIYNGMIV